MALRLVRATRLPPSSSEDGFTLVESLCAFLILSLTLVTASQALQMAIQSNARSDVNLEALMIAQEKLASFEDGAPIVYRQVDGVTSDSRYAWRVTENPIMAAGKAVSAHLVVQVYRAAPSGRSRQLIVELETFTRH